jgi:hypothetical protein
MESAALSHPGAAEASHSIAGTREDAGYQAFMMLRVAFAIAPIAFGLDKFFNVMVDWPKYLAPWIDGIVPGSAQQAMYAVGAIEIVAGLLVAFAPRIGVRGRRLARGHRPQPAYQERARVLRHRPPRLRAQARRAHARPARARPGGHAPAPPLEGDAHRG